MSDLLDVSVLIPLIDVHHEDRAAAQQWLSSHSAWATCPITENGVIRIVGGTKYPNSPGSVGLVMALVEQLCLVPGHSFWPDDVRVFDAERIRAAHVTKATQLTDAYLLALAVAHGGRLITFDSRMDASAVVGGAEALVVLKKQPC